MQMPGAWDFGWWAEVWGNTQIHWMTGLGNPSASGRKDHEFIRGKCMGVCGMEGLRNCSTRVTIQELPSTRSLYLQASEEADIEQFSWENLKDL